MNLPIIIRVPPLPQTTTILALMLMTGVLLYTPMLAWLGDAVPAAFTDEVISTGKFFRDALLLVLGFYFAKVVNAGQQDMANRAIDAAVASTPPTAPPAE
jgi:hypothetical protein